MNQFKAEFVKTDDGDAVVKEASTALTALSQSNERTVPTPPIAARVVQRPADASTSTASLATVPLPGSLSPTSSATSQPEVPYATGGPSAAEHGEAPPTSWETQDADQRWEERNNPAFTSHWLGPSYAGPSYAENATTRGHLSLGPSPTHDPVELRPPPVLPSFTFETDGFNIAPSLGDVASLAPANSLPTEEELNGADKYGGFAY